MLAFADGADCDHAARDWRPSGWVLTKSGGGRGPSDAVLHAPDCGEAPHGAPVLTVERALDAAEKASVRLCSLCGAGADLEPLLRGFGHLGDGG
ncbi:DUF6233 domain-containing protein [Streptomyces sp. NPDC001848]|uniref:DUF6233 domain-containing protein n=1 Tax=Streptomyces sp. NPDC001848 TaxID=3364618 RepID=UPI0036784610